MARPTGKIFMTGRSQAVRLPKQFRLPGREVRLRRVGSGLLLEPIETDARVWLADLQAHVGGDFPDRDQPPMLSPTSPWDD
jgi:antitoxin VapB